MIMAARFTLIKLNIEAVLYKLASNEFLYEHLHVPKVAKTGITECKGIKIAPEHLKNGAPARNFTVFSSISVRFGAL